MPTAFITGITGQDGSYLADALLARGYEVHGLIRRTSLAQMPRIRHLLDKVYLYRGDLTDAASVRRAVEAAAPDEVYHLGAQSHVGASFDAGAHALDVTAKGTFHVLEAVAAAAPRARVYNACSSEIFGNTGGRLNEQSAIQPQSPYGVAKAASLYLTRQFRSRGLYVSSGILFNHASPRQAPEFVGRKITRAAARIAAGLDAELQLGRLSPRRDWGWAPDYVEAMIAILQHECPTEVVVGMGVSHSVGEFVEVAFDAAGVDWQQHVRRVAPDRPSENEIWDLVADASLARDLIGWAPKVDFESMIWRMVAADKAALGADG